MREALRRAARGAPQGGARWGVIRIEVLRSVVRGARPYGSRCSATWCEVVGHTDRGAPQRGARCSAGRRGVLRKAARGARPSGARYTAKRCEVHGQAARGAEAPTLQRARPWRGAADEREGGEGVVGCRLRRVVAALVRGALVQVAVFAKLPVRMIHYARRTTTSSTVG